MRYRKTIVLLTVLLMVFSLNTLAGAKEIKKVNVAPLMKIKKGGISSADQLKSMVETYAERIREGFELAGSADLYPAFMEQIKSAEIVEKDLPKGQEMQWMLFYSQKKVKALNQVVWGGKKTLPVFALTINTECKEFHFVIPKACGNVSLVDSANLMASCGLSVSPAQAGIGDTITIDASSSKCADKVEITVNYEGQFLELKKLEKDNLTWTTSFKKPGKYTFEAKALNPDGVLSNNECKGEVTIINVPPVCNLQVTPATNYVGKPFKVDASASTDKDGKVVKADVTIKDKAGKELETKSLTTEPMSFEKIFKKPGIYNFSLKVTDDWGAVSGNDCTAQVVVKKVLFWLVEAGPGVAKGTYSAVAFGRFGLAYFFVPDKVSVIASAGAAFALTGKPFKHHFLSNVTLNYHADKLFIGGGFGFSSAVRDPDWKGGVDLVGNIGYDILKAFGTRASIFGEIRVPLRKDLEFKHGHEFLLGFRYLF